MNLTATEPRHKPGYTRGPQRGGQGACSKCPENIRLICEDRGRNGRYVLCELPDELDMVVEHATTQ